MTGTVNRPLPVPGPGEVSPAVRVADSFLVDDGRVRGLDLHRDRFAASCTGVEIGDFWAEVVARLPRDGRWFPRVELSAAGKLALRLRPAPPIGGPVRVLPFDGPDPRTSPRVKGPDLAVLGELRAWAAEAHGADEVLLMTLAGEVLEGAYASLLWWEDNTLCLPPQSLPLLPSVTVRLLRQIAAGRRVRVAERSRHLADLAGREAWLVSALHGIRPVAGWLGGGPPAGPVRRAPEWQLALRSLAVPLPPRPN
jgi:branched-subunit amino acid aminotransferase/4-amino-4-deoxychorismate lyase